MVVFHKVIYHPRSSFIKGRLPSKVALHEMLSSLKGLPPSKVVLLQRSSSIKESDFKRWFPSLKTFASRAKIKDVKGDWFLPIEAKGRCQKPV